MTSQAVISSLKSSVASPAGRHRMLVLALAGGFLALFAWLTVIGLDYYLLDAAHRVRHPSHGMLRPSGTVGIRLGIGGVLCFAVIFLYAIRKRVKVLQRMGKTKNWLDLHVVLGLATPVLITFHSSFKLHGLAGIAWWIMMAVMASGLVGRYFYAQIPRSIHAAELSLQELKGSAQRLSEELSRNLMFTAAELHTVLRMPSQEDVDRLGVAGAILLMLSLDMARPFRLARLRRRAMSPAARVLTLGGLLRSQQKHLEEAIQLVRQQSWISAKILMLDHTHRVFQLWHVVHRPFSYSFVILVTVHVTVVILMGYF